MIRWAVIFLILGLVCGLFGFYGAESAFVGIAKILAVIALVVFLVFLVLGLMAGKGVANRL